MIFGEKFITLQMYRDIAEIKKNIFGIIYLILPHKKYLICKTHTQTQSKPQPN